MIRSLLRTCLGSFARRAPALVGLLLLAALPSHAQNLLTNGDFSATDANGLPTAWTLENPALVSIDATQAPAGQTQSLKVATQDEGTSTLGIISQALNVSASNGPLLPDAHYVARVWLKSTVNDLARLEIKRYNGQTELDRTDSTGSFSDWSKVAVNIDTTGATRVEVLLRYKKNTSAAGQTAWFAGAELITAADAGSEMTLGTLSLVPTFESISAYAGFSGTFTTQTLELQYRVAGATDWRDALSPVAYTADNEFRGSILLLQPNTTYEVRGRLWLDGTLLDEKTTTTTTWTDEVPIASEITLPANSTATYTITAQGTPTGWIRYRAASGGSTIDVTGNPAATEAVVLDHAAYVIVEGLTIRGGTKNGLRVDNSHDIRIRNCDVSNWSAPGTFTLVNQGDIAYGYVDSAGASINLRAGIRIFGSESTRVVLERNLIHHPVGKSPSWAFGHPNGPEGIVLETTGGNNVVRFNDILAADGHYFNDAIESVQNGSVDGGPYRDTDIYGNLLEGANDDGTELDGGQMNVRYWHNWVEGGSGSVSTAPNLKGSSFIFRNVLVTGDERGGAQAGSIKMGGAPGVTFLLQNTIIAPGYGLTSGHYTKAGAVSPILSRNNLFTGLLPGDGRVRLDEAVSGDLDYDLIPPEGVLPSTFVPGPGREEFGVFAMPQFVAPEQRDFLLAAGSAGIAAGTPLANLTPDGVTAPDLGAVDTSNQNASWPLRPASPETAPNLVKIRVRQGQTATAAVTLMPVAGAGWDWSARGGDAWLTVSPATGSSSASSQTLQCTVDTASLDVGEHRSFASIRSSTGALRTVPVVVQVEPPQTLTFSRETETALPLAGFTGGTDADASAGGYVKAVTLQPGETTNGEIGLDFNVPEAGTYFILARVRATGPSNLIPTQDSIVLRVDDSEDYRWDLWGIGEDTWSWNRAYVVPATPTSDVIGKFTFQPGPHHVAVVARELGAQIDQIAVSNDPFLPASSPGPVPAIFTATLPNGGMGVAYEHALLGAGEAPLLWSVVGGALPSGLTLSGNGVISGTPTTLGTSNFTVQVADANGDVFTRVLSLTITEPPAAAPEFNPAGGTYTTVQTVSITSATSGATIRYTTDGSAPSATNGAIYSGPVTLSATTTLRAVAFASGMSESPVTSATYVINLPQAAAPQLTPAPGTYGSPQTVTLTSATTGAAIRYTTDGSVPTATSGTVYTGPVTISATTTLRAIAYASGILDSPVTSGTYAIGGTPAFQFANGQVVMEAEHFATETAGAGQDWLVITQDGAAGAATNNAMQGLPNLGVGYPALDASLPRVDYLIDVPETAAGNYYVHLRDFGATSSDDSVYVSIDGSTTVSQVVSAARTLDWKSSPGTLALPAGQHTLTLWMREDGVVVDRIVVDTIAAAPTGVGPAESGFSAPPTVGAPIFDPAGGTFEAAQTVAITSATNGAAIRYTLDGTTPSATAGIVYSAPISIAETATLRAVAYLTDGSTSSVSSATYTIDIPSTGGNGAFQMSGGQLVMEAENFTSHVDNGPQTWTVVTTATASGGASNNAVQSLPNVGLGYPTLDPTVARIEYQIDVPADQAGNYYVHLRDVGATSNDDSVYVSIDASATVSQVVTAGRTLDWKTSAGRLAIPAGSHTLTIWTREDGIVVDKIVVDGTSAAPTGFGPAESSRAVETSQVRHAPVINGAVEGSLQVLTGESFALNSSARVNGDLLVPGVPTVKLNGAPVYAGTLDGAGAETPTNYQVTLNSSAVLQHVVRRTDPSEMPVVAAPPAPQGTRNVALNLPTQSAGDFATIRDLTLNGNVGAVTVPAGTYGRLTANTGSSFVLGMAGATQPAEYNLQGLTLNSGSHLEIAGPVILTIANGVSLNGTVGAAAQPKLLTLKIASGGVTLNSGAALSGVVLAPTGTITLNGPAQLIGRIACDRLVLNSGSTLDVSGQ
ncbi:MAG TPA: chitobiase/beta-hexosaminidase C-terminal domain-containing protein [Opitutaceae bacterium]|nr:chitobiase/beta-hexosaminidase C-terminal domain-containing protein [Opitutaceae bacterium]